MASAFGQVASVERGRVTFTAECSRCHVPTEMDARLKARWIGRSGQELFEQVRSTMPAETPGSLSNEQYYDLTAFILDSGNVNIEGGKISVPELAALTINPGAITADANAGISVPWADYHGDKGANRYSALDQINASNVADLEIAWSFDTGSFWASP
jgi:hypothetical protein